MEIFPIMCTKPETMCTWSEAFIPNIFFCTAETLFVPFRPIFRSQIRRWGLPALEASRTFLRHWLISGINKAKVRGSRAGSSKLQLLSTPGLEAGTLRSPGVDLDFSTAAELPKDTQKLFSLL